MTTLSYSGHKTCLAKGTMRKVTFVLAAIPIAVLAAACSSSNDSGATSDESALTEAELAKKALQILGAQRIEGASQQCNQCHDINQKQLRTWQEQYKGALANIDDPNKTPQQKVDGFRVET